MKKNFLGLAIVLFSTVLFISYSVTHAFFTNTATSTNNTFTAAEVFPTGDESITPTATPTATPTPDITGIANHIVISEIQTATPGASTSDFAELYNPTSFPVDLSGWTIRKRNSSGTETSLVLISNGKSISAHGFFLWASSDGGYNVVVGADQSNGNNLSGDNSIALENSISTIIDQVAWGNGTNQLVETSPFTTNPPAGESIERKAYSTSTNVTMGVGGIDELKGNGYDAGNNATDFVLRTNPQPKNSASPTETP